MGQDAGAPQRQIWGRLNLGWTLLVGSSGHSWRDWFEAGTHSDVLVADPCQAEVGPPGRLVRLQGGRPVAWRFIGATDFLRNPVGWLAGALDLAEGEPCVILPEPSESPVCRQMMVAFSQVCRAERILAAEGCLSLSWPWPVGPEEVPLSAGFPPLVRDAQRRARWLELLENCALHEVRIADIQTQGCRLGTGRRVEVPSGHGEVSGGHLLWVTAEKPDDAVVSRLLDDVHAHRLHLVDPRSYHGTLCSFALENGEDFGMGVIKRFDPGRGLMEVLNTAVVPAPVRVLKVGTLRIDSKGKEIGAHTPWAV